MRDLYLKFKDKKEMQEVFTNFGFEIIDDSYYFYAVSVDIIGTIWVSIDEESFIELEGYHVNLRVLDEELDLSELNDYMVNPETPSRIWA